MIKKINIQIIGLIITVAVVLITNSLFNHYASHQSNIMLQKRDTINQILKDLSDLSLLTINSDNIQKEYLKSSNDTIFKRINKLKEQEFKLIQKIVSEIVENNYIDEYNREIVILSKQEIDFSEFLESNTAFYDWIIENPDKTLILNESITEIENILREKRNSYIANSQRIGKLISITDLIETVLIVLLTIMMVVILNNEKIKYKKLADDYKQVSITKDKFFSIISHDLKSPFNSILGFSELLLKNIRKYPVEKTEKFVENIYNVSKNTFNLLENLLEWSRVQSKKIKPNFQHLLINEIINDVVELLKDVAEQKLINLTFENNSELKINADEEMLKTVLRNLISNAIKFTDVNGNVAIKSFEKNKKVYLEVVDSGVGMDENSKNNLFKIGLQHSTIGINGEKGTGLGLILCFELMELNNGKIFVESEKDKGTKFTLEFDLIS